MNWKRLLSGKRTVTSEPFRLLIYFMPKRDITVRELAYITLHRAGLGSLNDGMYIMPEQWDKLPSNVKRHFQTIQPKHPWTP